MHLGGLIWVDGRTNTQTLESSSFHFCHLFRAVSCSLRLWDVRASFQLEKNYFHLWNQLKLADRSILFFAPIEEMHWNSVKVILTVHIYKLIHNKKQVKTTIVPYLVKIINKRNNIKNMKPSTYDFLSSFVLYSYIQLLAHLNLMRQFL